MVGTNGAILAVIIVIARCCGLLKAQWKKKIKKACEDAGTYKPFFDSVIDTLALIMQTRDEAVEKYDGNPTIEYTNKGGSTNIVKNPALVIINDMNRDALAYWKDLGLTPNGLKKINDAALNPDKKDAFAEAMAKLGI